jgi:uncharacterized protein (TIGR00369 family)
MPEPPEEIRSPFDALVGTEWLDDDPEHARARVPVRDDLRQPTGLLHGGVLLTLVESLCSKATAVAVIPEGKTPMGQSINVSFLRPVTEGHAEVEARARHRGRTTWVWEAEVRDDERRLCALAQMTIAVRPISRAG